MKLFKNITLGKWALFLSAFVLTAFQYPFFSHAISRIEPGFNGIMVIVCLALIMLAGNYFIIYTLGYLLRTAGKWIAALFYLFFNSIAFYFIVNFDVLIDDTMMGNVFHTNFAEATSYNCWGIIAYITLLGIVPSVLFLKAKINYGSIKRFFANIGVSLGTVIALVLLNMPNWTWIDRNSTVLGSLILPWNYIVNTFRYNNEQKALNRKENILPDATFRNNDKTAMILMIGESSTAGHYSLLGYERETNPLMSKVENLKAFQAKASATYTIGGTKAILEYKDDDELNEILPNYLNRNGADVTWKTTNCGEPPVHIEKYLTVKKLAAKYPEADSSFDGILTEGLAEEIEACGNNKVLVVLHTSTSHGPAYYSKYPAEFERFTPVCRTVEMAKAKREEVMNAYDNTILYTDWLISDVISRLKTLQGWKTGLIYVSDHGESLGENNLYMHGMPISIAPKEQYEIPFIVWTSDGTRLKETGEMTQHHVFHSVLHFLGADSEIYDEEMNIFK